MKSLELSSNEIAQGMWIVKHDSVATRNIYKLDLYKILTFTKNSAKITKF